MRIGIDLTALIAKPTGVDRYLLGMVSSLAGLDSGDDYVLFANVEDLGMLRERLGPDAPARLVPACTRWRPTRLVFQQVLLPAYVAAMRIEVLHSPTFIMPMVRGRAGHLLTIHDMSSFLTPERHPLSRRGRLYEWAVSTSARRADLVSVPAPSVRDDVLSLVPGLSPDRVRVAACGIDDGFRPPEPDVVATTLSRLGVQGPYLLYLGTLDPRKNLPSLVQAFSRLVARGRPERLVLAGQPGWSIAALRRTLEASGLSDRVQVLGYVDEADLPSLYAGAAVFAYPSLLEGFGFPPLEAMACGAPVVSSRNSSLRDNLEGAADLVDPHDLDGLTQALMRMVSDPAYRAERVAAGLARAARFRWPAFARTTSGLYHEIATRRRGPQARPQEQSAPT